MPLRFRLLGLALFGFWLAMMTALVRRDILPELEPPTTADYRDALETVEPERPVVDRLGIWLAGSRVGFTQSTTTRRPNGGYAIEGISRFDLGKLAKGLPIASQLPAAGLEGLKGMAPTIRTTALVTESFRLDRFDIAVEAGGETHYILGQQVGNRLRITTLIGGKSEQQEIPFDGRSMLGGLLFPGRFSGELRLGHAWEERFVDPFSGKVQVIRKRVTKRESIVVGGAAHEAFVVTSETRGSPVTRIWVAADGAILREQRGFGLRMEREPVPETAETSETSGTSGGDGSPEERPAK